MEPNGMEPKKSRSHKSQIRMLLQYMQEHPAFAVGKYTSTRGQIAHEREWEQLKTLLNELGPMKTVKQWKVCWRDQKSRARTEGGEHKKALNKTGNLPVPELSENTAMVLNAIGEEMATGVGPDESPIGHTGTASTATQDNQAEATYGVSGTSGVAGTSGVTAASGVSGEPAVIAASGVAAARTQMTRKRRNTRELPPDRFLDAQKENNKIMQSINVTLNGNQLAESNALMRLKLQGQIFDHNIDIGILSERNYVLDPPAVSTDVIIEDEDN